MVNNPEVGPVQLKGHEGEVIAIDWYVFGLGLVLGNTERACTKL
ncbi:hypothetical protein MRB53_016671 [Persea americana]|uniref:Uncharacterized protein n=1 Tax=Persea americana TaxID=3435 RepID=A0ACC2M484_PERAE|nr:hypothetical protein MRB53_016671 [Persea americana]